MLEDLSRIGDPILQNDAAIKDIEDKYSSGVYPKRPLTLVRGSGSNVWDAEGKRYLDLTGGQGVALVGHAHPQVVAAIQEQAQQMITCPEIFYNGRRAELYTLLSNHTPADLNRFFLCNSGAEAVEAALKFARWQTGREEIIAFNGGFHGRTMGALSATWNPSYRQPFEPLVPEIRHIPFNDLEAARKAISGSTAAVLLEVIQGEGGVVVGQADFLRGVRALCDRYGALLILDEIQTGLGRTGAWFACEHFELRPDVLCLGKGLGGGVPIGAIAWSNSLGSMPRGSHGSTFGGNPLVCAAAVAALTALEKIMPMRVNEIGGRFLESLRSIDHPLIREIRGRGLMIGIDLRVRVTPILKSLLIKGVLALPAGPTVLRLLPPLTVTETELEQFGEYLIESLEEFNGDQSG